MDEASSCRAVSAPAVLRTFRLLAVFQTQNGRAARTSALSPEGETANTESWSGQAVDGARAAQAAS